LKNKSKILFVCLGNICRSPTAHAILEKKILDENLQHKIIVDSAGTGDWHIGRPPDLRAQKIALRHNYDLSNLKARQVSFADFYDFDYILAMDKQNLIDLKAMAPLDFSGSLQLFLDYGSTDKNEVPDPYIGGEGGFEGVLFLIEDAVDGLFRHLIR
jgi:protein-tyrosine phosphatase